MGHADSSTAAFGDRQRSVHLAGKRSTPAPATRRLRHPGLLAPSRGIRIPAMLPGLRRWSRCPATVVSRSSRRLRMPPPSGSGRFPDFFPGADGPGIHISRPDTMAIPRRTGVVGHVGQFFPDEITSLDGLLLTIARPDLAGCFTPDEHRRTHGRGRPSDPAPAARTGGSRRAVRQYRGPRRDAGPPQGHAGNPQGAPGPGAGPGRRRLRAGNPVASRACAVRPPGSAAERSPPRCATASSASPTCPTPTTSSPRSTTARGTRERGSGGPRHRPRGGLQPGGFDAGPALQAAHGHRSPLRRRKGPHSTP